ncbi:MAG: tetratricopeptide repeat protein [Bacteroidetes bacterium]|nr:tetratricopeptide repeat protein [Bacteroidota bacterium]
MKTIQLKRNTILSALLLAFFTVTLTSFAFSGETKKVVLGEKIMLNSKVLNEDRQIMVYTPKGYEESSESYPVIYLLDGEWHFMHASGIVDFLSGQGLMPASIVVAIVNVDRNRDFTPTAIEAKANTGGADQFTAFIKKELMPYVHENYRTLPFETIYGHSLGGMYVAHTFLHTPDLFDGYIAVSPYLGFDDKLVAKEASEKLRKSYDHKFFYMTLGDEPTYYESVGQFVGTIQTSQPEGLVFKYTQMEGQDHNSTPHLTLYAGMQTIYHDWKLPKAAYKEGIASVDQHYKKLSKTYGYEIKAPEFVLNLMGYNYMWANNFEKAIDVLTENAKRFPQSANVYDSLGEALEKSGQIAEARQNYEKAVKIAKNDNHPYLKVYEENLNRVQEVVAEK